MTYLDTQANAIPKASNVLIGPVLLFLTGFIASQRFTLDSIYHFAPVAPLILAIISGLFQRNIDKMTSYTLLALFLTVDLGGEHYAVTARTIRYLTYAVSIVNMIALTKPTITRPNFLMLLGVALVSILGGLIAATNPNVFFSITIFYRDILLFFCIAVVLMDSSPVSIDLTPLFLASAGFLFGETINVALFYNASVSGYMNLASMKAFIILPLIFLLMRPHKNIVAIVLVVIVTIMVVFAYNSKMLLISTAIAFLIVQLAASSRSAPHLILAIIGTMLIISSFQIIMETFSFFEHNRVFKYIQLVTSSEQMFDTFTRLNPVRTSQHILFFSQDTLPMLLGNGFGAGLIDQSGTLAAVANETAFSEKELQSSIFFNFHDIWIDFGLRYGLVTVIAILLILIRFMSRPSTKWMGLVLFIFIINTTFSIGGLLMTTLFFKVLVSQSKLSEKPEPPLPAR